MREYRSKIEQKNICRKCKNVFLSVDGSPCPNPECSEIEEELESGELSSKETKKGSKKELTRTRKQTGEEDSQDTDSADEDDE